MNFLPTFLREGKYVIWLSSLFILINHNNLWIGNSKNLTIDILLVWICLLDPYLEFNQMEFLNEIFFFWKRSPCICRNSEWVLQEIGGFKVLSGNWTVNLQFLCFWRETLWSLTNLCQNCMKMNEFTKIWPNSCRLSRFPTKNLPKLKNFLQLTSSIIRTKCLLS